MKKNFGLVLFLFMVSIINAQQNVSMLLLDEKNMNIQQQDVSHIYITVCGLDSTTAIYSEFFFNPKVVNGIVNLKIGEGKPETNGTSYSDAVSNYFKSLPTDKMPNSESSLFTKFEVHLKNGTVLKFNDKIKLNNPIPLVKGDSTNVAYLSSDQFLIHDNDSLWFEINRKKLSIKNKYTQKSSLLTEGLMGIYSPENGTMVKAGKATFVDLNSLPGPANLSNITPVGLKAAFGEKHADFIIDGVNLESPEKSIKIDFINDIQILNKDYGAIFGANSGASFNNLTTKDFSFITPDNIGLGNNGVKIWDIDGKGFRYTGKVKRTFELNTDFLAFLDETTNSSTKIGPGTFGTSIGGNQIWAFGSGGGLYNSPDGKYSHAYAPAFHEVYNKELKISARFGFSGFTSYTNDKLVATLGSTLSGRSYLGQSRSGGNLFWGSTENSEGGIDQSGFNPNGQIIARLTTLAGTNGVNPYWFLSLNGGTPGVSAFISTQGVSTIQASVKNFRMDHPLYADQDIVYASLEGPEAGAYCRGKGQVVSGKTFIAFPDHFQFVCSTDELTVQLTPRSAKSRGLAVTNINQEGFEVEELMDGKGNYDFYWEVKGVRKGFENYKVIRSKKETMPVEFVNPGLEKN